MTQPIHILVVEDDAAIATLLRFHLEQAGFRVSVAGSTAEADFALSRRLPDLLVLDWMLPDGNGPEWAQKLRGEMRTRELPLIMLTARGSEDDKEYGLNLGADDYLTKPFSPRELLARIHALLRRRAPQKTADDIEIDGLRLQPSAKSVLARGEKIAFGPTEFKLLHFFMTHRDRIYSRRQLLDLVWGDHIYVEERTVDVHIRRLRRGLETHGMSHLIQTVRGSGYRFCAEAVL